MVFLKWNFETFHISPISLYSSKKVNSCWLKRITKKIEFKNLNSEFKYKKSDETFKSRLISFVFYFKSIRPKKFENVHECCHLSIPRQSEMKTATTSRKGPRQTRALRGGRCSTSSCGDCDISRISVIVMFPRSSCHFSPRVPGTS